MRKRPNVIWKWPNDIQLNKFNDVRHVRNLPFTSIPFCESMEGMNTTKKMIEMFVLKL